METNHKYPLVVEVVMYRHNLTDSKIINEVRKNARINKISDTNFFVSTSDIREILETKFKKDVEFQISLPQDSLAKNVTSALFLHNVISSFTNLKFIKFNVSEETEYTRKKGEQISFDYRVLHAKIDLPALVESKNELRDLQRLFLRMKIWDYDRFFTCPYIEISTRDLLDNIHILESTDDDFVEEFGDIANNLFKYIDLKLESDNTMIQLIVLE